MTEASVADRPARRANTPREFQVGEEYARVTILRVVNAEARREERLYWVRYACCQRAGELSHRALRQRGINGSLLCAECADRKHARVTGDAAERERQAAARRLAMSGSWRVAG